MLPALRFAGVLGLLASAGCNALSGQGSKGTGQACSDNSDCSTSFCLPFADGYCSADCSQTPCGDQDKCVQVGGGAFCLLRCSTATDCREGYQCFGGACRPACSSDADCSRGFGCNGGACTALPGNPAGAACQNDGECSSRYCEPVSLTCQAPCVTEDDCAVSATCYVNPVDTSGSGITDDVHPICIDRRNGAAGLASRCTADTDCAQGSCELGQCTILCGSSGICPAGQGCYKMLPDLDQLGPTVRVCLPREGNLERDLPGKVWNVGGPEHAVSISLFVEAQGENLNYYAGLDAVTDPSGSVLYSSQTDFFLNPLRFEPAEGAVMMLLSNSPLVQFEPLGVYTFVPFAVTMAGAPQKFTVRARYKLHDGGPLQTGKMPLHVFVTNLRGGCLRNVFDASSAPSALSQFEAKMRQIYMQAGIDLSEITYADSSAAASITVNNDGTPSPELDGLLADATSGDTPDALELVLVRQILGGSADFEILGISGGIPAPSGIPGTIHSGAAVSLSSLCYSGMDDFALTAAHELGHTMGLFHSIEQDGHTDQMDDDDTDGSANLMYWQDASSVAGRVSPQQGAVLRSSAIVQP